jgi:hypothetical protein
MLHAYKTGNLFEHSVFTFIKSGSEAMPLYYLTDITIGSIVDSDKIWGIIINNIEEKMDNRMSNILELTDVVKKRYANLEHSPNTHRLESYMNELFDEQRTVLLGNRL